MVDSFYLTGWGALWMTLILFVPFAVVFLYVIIKKSSSNSGDPGSGNYSRVEALWVGLVVVVFVGVNLGSIGYMPTVATATANASGQDILDVDITAESWAFDISSNKIEVGRPVRFSGKSMDTMHSFAVYHPNGKVLFTMMLMPGLDNPTSLIHTFTEPGTYTVRCLEYCGLSHHEMLDELVVVAKSNG
jgi:cytochrome c oxidase subunit 2